MYKSLLNYKSSSIVNSLSFFERAAPPADALPSKRAVIIGSAVLAGLMLALLAIFLLELLDTRVHDARDLEDQFKINSLGYIPLGPPMLVAPEAFANERLAATRDAQTNIMLAAAERGTRTLMITSPQPSESRTAFSLDLADLFSRSGHKVLIVDADTAQSFLTHMLMPQVPANAQNVFSAAEKQNVWSYLHPTPLPNVALLPGQWNSSGAPAMLPSLRWRELVQQLLDAADVIIFDGPSALNGPDAALLAPHIDGVVLALDPAVDNREEVAKSKQRLLHQNGSHLLGAVTFTPSQQQLGAGSVWRQLRGQQQLSLPEPSAPERSAAWAAVSERAAGPIITPAPTNDGAEMGGDSSPLVTPVPAEVMPIVAEEGYGQVIEVVQEQAPAATARRPRKAARSSRRSNRGDGAAE